MASPHRGRKRNNRKVKVQKRSGAVAPPLSNGHRRGGGELKETRLLKIESRKSPQTLFQEERETKSPGERGQKLALNEGPERTRWGKGGGFCSL